MYPLTIKNPCWEIQLFRRRVIVASAIIVFLTLALLASLFHLQILRYKRFATLSNNNAIDLVPIAPRRGIIYDRNGIVLAHNIPVFSLMVIPDEIPDLKEMIQEVNKIVSLTDNDLQQFYKQLKRHRPFDEIPLKLKLTNEEVARFSVNQYKFKGVAVKAQLIREYPLRGAFAHVVGYVSRIDENDFVQLKNPSDYAATNFIGKVGVEKYYQNILHGIVGYKKVEMNAGGHIVRLLGEKSPTPGNNIYLSIDSHLQIAAENALGKNRGTIVAIEPQTGEVLALVSQPTYDPNLFVGGISQNDYNALRFDPNHPLYNRTLHGSYSPGSTIKPFIALEGLNSNTVTPNYTIFDPGWYKLPNAEHIYHDWRSEGHGLVNMEKAIVQSCDTYFYNLAHLLGIKRVDEILKEFGFGQKTNIDLVSETTGILPTPKWKYIYRHQGWYSGDTILVGFGQGFLYVTPLQLAVATATLANHGIGFTPHLLYAVQKSNGKINYSNATPLSPIILNDPSYWKIVIDAMSKVVSQGTGYRFGIPKYTVAAKTGTAQVISHQDLKEKDTIRPEFLRNNSLFIAFAPVENPKIAVSVICENNSNAPIVARKVFDEYFKQA